MSESQSNACLKKRRVQNLQSGANAAARRPRCCPSFFFSFLFFFLFFLTYNSSGGRRLDGHRKLKTNICLSLREGGPPDSSSVHHQRPPQAVKVVRVKIPAASPGRLPMGVFFYFLWNVIKVANEDTEGPAAARPVCFVHFLYFLYLFILIQEFGGAVRPATLITSDRDRGSNTSVEWCCNRATTDWNTVEWEKWREMNRGREEQGKEKGHQSGQQVQQQEVLFCL